MRPACGPRRRAQHHRAIRLRIVADLTEAGYVMKEKEGRRNRYRIQEDLPLRDALVLPGQGGLAPSARAPSRRLERCSTYSSAPSGHRLGRASGDWLSAVQG